MQDDVLRTRFFMGSQSPIGFVSHFDKLYDPADGWHAYLIKGGPGTGKSTLMKGVLSAALAAGFPSQEIRCSSDPDSLDGVIIPTLKTCILDATAPHVLEPKYPGATETIVNLGEFWNAEKLRNQASQIIKTSQACTALHERAARYLAAAGGLLTDSYRFALECTDTAKIARYASRLAKREFGQPGNKIGHEQIRLLSAVTPLGALLFEDTAVKLCPQLFLIEDEYGASSRMIMAHLRTHALATGHDVITCYCAMSPRDKIDHLLLPELGIGFMTSNSWHTPRMTPYRRIHLQRFTDMDQLRQKRQRLSFNRRAARELIGEASTRMLEAKAVHDELEDFYIDAMDFGAFKHYQQDLTQKILSI